MSHLSAILLEASVKFVLGHPPFFRLLSNVFSDFGSVGRKRKKKNKKLKKESGNRRPGSSAQHPWSLETTRCGSKVNMAAMDEGKMDVVVQVKREQGQKDDPLKMQ